MARKTIHNFQCLNIDKELAVSTNPEERMKFWDGISEICGINLKT